MIVLPYVAGTRPTGKVSCGGRGGAMLAGKKRGHAMKSDLQKFGLVLLTLLAAVWFINAAMPWIDTHQLLIGSVVAGSVAITVGLLTYNGVKLSQVEAANRLRDELEHSRQESEKDRLHAANEAHLERLRTMRREVYLDAAAQLFHMQNHINQLPNIKLGVDNGTDGMKPFQIAVERVAIVAEAQTVTMARQLSYDFAILIVEAMRFLTPALIRKGNAEVRQQQVDAAMREMDRIMGLMRNHTENNIQDPVRYSALEQGYHAQDRLRERAQTELEAANADVLAATQQYVTFLRERMMRLMRQVHQLLAAIRAELGLVTNEDALQAQTNQMIVETQELIERVIPAANANPPNPAPDNVNPDAPA
ncbi:hypothetical protein [Caballeronia sp. KNU42]